MNTAQNPLTELVHDLEAEIQKHKWIESQKAGRDVGSHAIGEWLCMHFPDWKRHRWQAAVEEALAVV